MNTAAHDYFGNPDAYFETISLHDSPDLKWDEVSKRAPMLPKGWFELSKLSESIRLEFIRDFWFNALPYLPHVYAFLDRFFAGIESIGVILASQKEKAPFEAFLVYTLRGSKEFFLGHPPLLEKDIELFKKEVNFPLPEDYLQFFRIHNGFKKGADTGIIPANYVPEQRGTFLGEVETKLQGIQCDSELVDPQMLFPFYRSFGLDIYQCFYKNWYPDGQVGNVLCSLSDGTISRYKKTEEGQQTLAFTTFLDWLVFYLEGVES